MATTTGRHFNHTLGGHPRVTMLANQEISQLAPYAGLILVVSLVVFFLVRYYVFEGFFLKWMYGDTYLNLNDNRRRGFINHHVAATAKLIMLSFAAVPFFSIMAGKATMHTPFAASKVVTYGDVLLVLNQVFIAMYLFELIFRAKLSIVAVSHHIGSVTIAAIAVFLAVNWRHQPDATLEFILCYLWGMFDVIAESWPHIAIILYRVYPNDHKFLSYVMLSATTITFVGTIVETIVVMYFWAHAWNRWTLVFKIVTPILHVVFTAAQLWGSWNFYTMWQGQKKQMREKVADAEKGNEVVLLSPYAWNKTSDSMIQKPE